MLLCLHSVDALRRFFEYDYFGGLLVIGHVWDFVAQRKKTALELIPSLSLKHVMSPALVVILRVRRPGTRAFSIVADLFKHPAAVALELNPLDRGLLVSGRWVCRVIMLVNVDVTAFKN